MNSHLIQALHIELEKQIDPIYKLQAQKFSKEEIVLLGVRVPTVRKISQAHFKHVKFLPKETLLVVAEDLLKKPEQEYKTIALEWLYRIRKQYTQDDFAFFERCLKNYVSNWAICDIICTNTLGYFFYVYPEQRSVLKVWTQSPNRWVRRAAAVSLIYALRKKNALDEAFVIADILLMDSDDLVQKGYGWMLKVASNAHPNEVYAYVEKHKETMPRTALRYAIEKLPIDQRKKLMEKQ